MPCQGLGLGHEIFCNLTIGDLLAAGVGGGGKEGSPYGADSGSQIQFQRGGRGDALLALFAQGIHGQKEMATGGGFAWAFQQSMADDSVSGAYCAGGEVWFHRRGADGLQQQGLVRQQGSKVGFIRSKKPW